MLTEMFPWMASLATAFKYGAIGVGVLVLVVGGGWLTWFWRTGK